MSDINANAQLEELFPELRGLLDSWDQRAAAPSANVNGNGSTNGFENENGVEPTDIERAMQTRMAAMPYPQFQPGQSAPPPPPAHVEDGGPPQPDPTPQPQPRPEPQPVPQQQTEPPPSTPPTPPEPLPTEVTIGYDEDNQPITVPIGRLQTYAQFDEEFQTDEGLRQAVLNYYAQQGLAPPAAAQGVGTEQAVPQHTSVEAPPVPSPFPQQQPQSLQAVPDGVDLQDPTVVYLINQNQQLQNQIQMLAGGVEQTYQQQQARQEQENQSLINRAMESFKSQRGLSNDQMENIRLAAARLNVLPSLMQGVDPITGTPSKPDPLAALDRAFEIAYMQIPEFRQQEFAREIKQRVTDQQRKQKLAGLAGSSGSVPRTTPAPTDATGRRNAMIDEIRQMQNGEWSPPES